MTDKEKPKIESGHFLSQLLVSQRLVTCSRKKNSKKNQREFQQLLIYMGSTPYLPSLLPCAMKYLSIHYICQSRKFQDIWW